MYQRNNDVSDGCLATGEGTSETNFNKFSFDSKLKASDQHYGGHGLNSSLKLWKSFPWILHCQPTITNVDIDKANKAALVGAEDNLLTTHVVTKLHLLYKLPLVKTNAECTEIGKAPYNPKLILCVKASCLLFWLDLLQSIFCHSQVLAFQLSSTCVFLKGSCLSLRI